MTSRCDDTEKVKFDIVRLVDGAASGFDRGHISLSTRAGRCSSEDTGQNLMVYVDLGLLLDGLSEFMGLVRPSDYVFRGLDSPFRLVFARNRRGDLAIRSVRETLYDGNPQPVWDSLLLAASGFAEDPANRVDPPDAGSQTLDEAVRRYETCIKEVR